MTHISHMALALRNSKTGAAERTNRGTHDFNLPRAPRLVQFLLRLIVDLRMIHTRLDSTLTLSIQICRDPLRVLHKSEDQK